jgi:hypothetical protein
MQRFLVVLVALSTGLGIGLDGCNNDGARAADPPSGAAPRPLAGVYPEDWRCDSIAATAALGELLGGTVRQIDSGSAAQRGVPHACSYEVTAHERELWSFDIDCRDGMKQHAETMFAQYKASSTDQVARYEALADAGAIKPGDAGAVVHAPGPAVEVPVGAKGLDHHGQGLIFIDDDAPCYVRVFGKDAARRLELARLIAKNLTFANAPMTPRPFP